MSKLSQWLKLCYAPGLGSATIASLYQHFGSIEAIYNASPAALQNIASLKPESIDFIHQATLPTSVQSALEWQEHKHRNILTRVDPQYPTALAEIAVPPALLFVEGNPELLNDPQLAIVGSRNATRTGTEHASNFAQCLADSGLIITSGLALGIDAASHQGALTAGGLTIAVTATGLDRTYPAKHKNLAHDIVAKGGAVISEFPLGTPPRPEYFPRRNRIIAGLSLGVLVVEAAVRSGSLITARYAWEQGRDVFAIPGSIHNTLTKGCHQLIKQGAKLVETADDILEELAPQLKSALREHHSKPIPADNTPPLPQDQQTLLAAMGHDPISIDRLVERTPFEAAAIASMLLLLELNGHVRQETRGNYSRCL